MHRLKSNPNRRQQQQDRDKSCGNRLSFAMAIRVVLVGRLSRYGQRAQNSQRTEYICQRFHRIGHQGVRMSGDAGDKFGGPKNQVDDEPDEGSPQPAFEPGCAHDKVLTTDEHRTRIKLQTPIIKLQKGLKLQL